MDSLKQAVEEAAMLITILDPSTFDSEWVRAENEWARDAGLDILPFYAADRYRWDEISHWRTNLPHVSKYQASHSDWLPIGDHGGSCNNVYCIDAHNKHTKRLPCLFQYSRCLFQDSRCLFQDSRCLFQDSRSLRFEGQLSSFARRRASHHKSIGSHH